MSETIEQGRGIIFGDPRLLNMSHEEQIAYLADVTEHGMPANLPSQQRAAAEEPLDSPPVPAGIFDPAALSEGVTGRCEPYTMPNGQKVFVHPLSPEETMSLNRRVLQELRKAGLLKEGLKPEEAKAQGQAAQVELKFRAAVWATIYACRQSEDPQSPPVFMDHHAAKLRTAKGYGQAVQEIADLAESLQQGKSESVIIAEVTDGFFGRGMSWLDAMLSLSEPDGPTGLCREQLEDLRHSISSMIRSRASGTSVATCLSGLSLFFQMNTPE
jgi:hypothetical protein